MMKTAALLGKMLGFFAAGAVVGAVARGRRAEQVRADRARNENGEALARAVKGRVGAELEEAKRRGVVVRAVKDLEQPGAEPPRRRGDEEEVWISSSSKK